MSRSFRDWHYSLPSPFIRTAVYLVKGQFLNHREICE